MTASNRPNERLIPFTIADLALMATALSTAAAEAMLSGRQAVKIKERLRELTDMFDDMYPISRAHQHKEYAWYNAFSALAQATAYHLRIEAFAQYGWKTDAAKIVLVVDNLSFVLADSLSMRDTEGVIPDAYVKMFEDTLALVKEAVAMDAEFMNEVSIQVPHAVDVNDHRSYDVKKNEAAYKATKAALEVAGITDLPFAIRRADYNGVVVLVRPSDEARFLAIFQPEPVAGPKL